MGNVQSQTRRAAFTAQGQGFWCPTHTAVRKLILARPGLPKEAPTGPVLLTVYEAIKGEANNSENMDWGATYPDIIEACAGAVKRSNAILSVKYLKQLGVLDYTPGSQHVENVYRILAPSEVAALHQPALPLEAPAPLSSSPNSGLLPLSSSPNSDRSGVQKTPFSSPNSGPKQQDSASDSVKDNNSATQPSEQNVVVAFLGEASEEQKDAAYQALLQQGMASKWSRLQADTKPPQQIMQQIAYLPYRKAKTNKSGLLRRSIEDDWSAPPGYIFGEADKPRRSASPSRSINAPARHATPAQAAPPLPIEERSPSGTCNESAPPDDPASNYSTRNKADVTSGAKGKIEEALEHPQLPHVKAMRTSLVSKGFSSSYHDKEKSGAGSDIPPPRLE